MPDDVPIEHATVARLDLQALDAQEACLVDDSTGHACSFRGGRA
jgi:hypothetical protein